MIHFKNHKQPGSVFIEVMFALVLLAIFGTSLFMVQSIVFTKTFTAHSKVIALAQINTLNVEFQLEQEKQKDKKEPLLEKVSDEKVKAPLESIVIKSTDIAEESTLHKTFAKYVKIVQQTAQFDNKQETFLSFAFLPPLLEQEEKGASS